jgi:hypothetical protein
MVPLDGESVGFLAFAVPFLVFTLDVWQHGPVPAPLKHVGLAASLLALPVLRFEAFVAAELLWLALIAYAAAAGEPGKAATEEGEAGKPAAAAAAAVESGPPAVPAEGERRLQDGLQKALINLDGGDGKNNSEGKPWKQQQDSDGIKVWNSELPGESCKRWRCETVVKAPSIQALLEELFNFDVRAGPNGWDSAVKEGKVLAVFKGDNYSLARMSTNAAAGGAVSSREFIDIRAKYVGGGHPACPEGGALITNVGLEPKKDKSWLPAMPSEDKNLVLGKSLPGGGVRISPVAGQPGLFKYEMVTNMSLGGWLPSSVINSATGGALVESMQLMHAHLKKKF